MVRLVEDDEVMLGQHPGSRHQVGEVEGVVGDDQLRLIAPDSGQAVRRDHVVRAFRAQAVVPVRGQLVRPQAPVNHELQVGPVAVPVPPLRVADHTVHLGAQQVDGTDPLVRFPQLPQADVVSPSLRHGHGEFGAVGLLEERDVLAEELLLEGDRAGGDHGFLAALEDREEVAERLAAARTGLNESVPAGGDGLLNDPRHLKLLRTVFGPGQLGQDVPDDAFDHQCGAGQR